MDFPGTINVSPSTFVNLLIDIATSVAYHGFTRIVILNGHGSNHPARRAGGPTGDAANRGARASTSRWWQLSAEYWNEEVRESGPGGCAHACELETSMYMHVDGERVRRDRITGRAARLSRSRGWPGVAEGRPDARVRPGDDRRVDLDDVRDRSIRRAGAGDRREGPARLRAHRRAPGRDGGLVPEASRDRPGATSMPTPPGFELPFGF